MHKYSDINEILNKLREYEIHIIPYCHADYAWTHSRQWHIERYILIINEVLDIMKNNSDYTWMIDNYQHFIEPFFEYCPSRIEEFKQRIKEKRIEITNGIFSLVRASQIGEETFIRNIALGKKFFKQILPEIDINIYHNVDVAIGHSQLPQILKLGGYDYYRAWRPQGAMDFNGIPRQFKWRGLDGTEIITSRGFYGGFGDTTYMDKDLQTDWNEITLEFFHKEIKDIMENSCCKDLWISQGMDDARPLRDLNDKPSRILEFIKKLNNKEKINIHYSTAKDYYMKLSAQNLAIVNGVLDACDVGYNIPTKGEKGLWRMRKILERQVIKAETLLAFSSIINNQQHSEHYEDKINNLWMKLLKLSGHAMEFLFEDDYQDIYDMGLNCLYEAQSLINKAKHAISEKIETRSNRQYVVFNTLNWEREEFILLNIPSVKGTGKLCITDPYGKELEYQVINVSKGDINYLNTKYDEISVLTRVKIPPLGYSTINVFIDKRFNNTFNNNPGNISGNASNNASNNGSIKPEIENTDFSSMNEYSQIIDTGKIKVKFCEGRITNIWNENNDIIYDINSTHNVNNAQNDNNDKCSNCINFGDIMFTRIIPRTKTSWLLSSDFQGIDSLIPKTWKWEEYGPLQWKYVVNGYVGKNEIEQKIILQKDSKCIDFELKIFSTEVASGFFSVRFPSERNPEIVTDIPFGLEKRNIENEPYGKLTDIIIDNFERTVEGVFTGRSWVSSIINGHRYSVVSKDCPSYYLFDKNNPSISVILTRIIDYKNQQDWMSKTHPWMDCRGIHNFKYSFYIHDDNEGYYQVIKLSKEKAYEPEVQLKLNFNVNNLIVGENILECGLTDMSVTGKGPENCEKILPQELKTIEIDDSSTIISAFYKDSEKYILRLYESKGEKTKIKFKLPGKLIPCEIVDFNGIVQEQHRFVLEDNGKAYSIELKPWQIINIVLKAGDVK